MSRDKLVNSIAKQIVNQQYSDNAKFGIENHFLVDVINEVLAIQADRIKDAADFIFKYAKESGVKKIDDNHSIQCKILVNSDEKSVLTIKDESIYGPNMDYILVIDDKETGCFHIKNIFSPSILSSRKKNSFKIERTNFTDADFVFYFEYMPQILKRTLSNCNNEKDRLDIINDFKQLRTLKDMNDNTFNGYERIVYSTGLLFSVKNQIKRYKNEK